jgi:hypothetical protein
MGIEKFRITFKSDEPAMSFTCLLDGEPATPTGGYGGWDIIDRPRRMGITQWGGRQPLQMDIPILIDGFKDRDDVELECSILEKMAWPKDVQDGGGTVAPPIISIECDAIPHDKLDYVIADLQWGAVIRANASGKRVRQHAIVQVIRYSAPDRIQLSASAAARKNKKLPKPRIQIRSHQPD